MYELLWRHPENLDGTWTLFDISEFEDSALDAFKSPCIPLADRTLIKCVSVKKIPFTITNTIAFGLVQQGAGLRAAPIDDFIKGTAYGLEKRGVNWETYWHWSVLNGFDMITLAERMKVNSRRFEEIALDFLETFKYTLFARGISQDIYDAACAFDKVRAYELYRDHSESGLWYGLYGLACTRPPNKRFCGLRDGLEYLADIPSSDFKLAEFIRKHIHVADLIENVCVAE